MLELQRIHQEYRRRAREIPPGSYSLTKPTNLFLRQQRTRCVLEILRRDHFLPLGNRRILEIGCGAGGWLPDFEAWGAQRDLLAGIDLDEARVAQAQRLLSAHRGERGTLLTPGADIRLGDATNLPWPDGCFDLVLQSTVFTSVLDGDMKKALAAEMLRVLKPGGMILWYDFCFNNPNNRNVRGITKREIAALFPNCCIKLQRITLAPPLARRIVPVTWLGALVLEKLSFLNSHYLGLMRKQLR